MKDATGSRAALWWALALVYPALLVVASRRPEFGAEVTRMIVERVLPPLNDRQVHIVVVALRKLVHFLGYYLFATILTNAFLCLSHPPRSRRTRAITYLAVAMTAVGVACLDEYIQLGSAFRTGALQDVLLDSLGIAVGLVVRIMSAQSSERL